MKTGVDTHQSFFGKTGVIVGSAIVGVLSNSIQTSFFTLPEESFASISGPQFSIAATIITALALLLMALLARRSPRFVAAVPYLGLALTGMGLAALVCSDLTPALLIAAALLIGTGVAFGFGFWIVITAGFGYRTAVLVLAGFRCLSALGSFAARAVGSFEVWPALLVALFALSVPLTIAYARHGGWAQDPEEHTEAKPGASGRSEVGKLRQSIVFVCVFGFTSGALRAFSQIEHVNIFSAAMLTCTIAGILLALAIVTFARHGFEARAVRVAMLLGLATLYLVFPFAPEGWWVVFFALGDMLYVAASMHMNFATVAAAKNNPLVALVVLGVFKGCVFLSVGLGFAANSILYAFLGRSTTGLLTLSLVVVYLVMLGALPSILRKSEKSAALVDMTGPQIRSNDMLRKVYGLSDREMDVLILTLGGSSASVAADKLYVTENTVKTHLKRMYVKLGVHSKDELRSLVAECLGG